MEIEVILDNTSNKNEEKIEEEMEITYEKWKIFVNKTSCFYINTMV